MKALSMYIQIVLGSHSCHFIKNIFGAYVLCGQSIKFVVHSIVYN